MNFIHTAVLKQTHRCKSTHMYDVFVVYWIAIRIQTQICFENCDFLLYVWRHSANSMLSVVCQCIFVSVCFSVFLNYPPVDKERSLQNNSRKLKPMNTIIHAYHTRKLFQLVHTLFDSEKINVGAAVWHVSRRFEIIVLTHFPQIRSLIWRSLSHWTNDEFNQQNNLHNEIRFHRHVPSFTHFN